MFNKLNEWFWTHPFPLKSKRRGKKIYGDKEATTENLTDYSNWMYILTPSPSGMQDLDTSEKF